MEFSYDRKQLLSLMQNFYDLTQIKTVLYDNRFNTLAAVPYEECAFCAALSRVPAAHRQCHACNMEGIRLCKEKLSLTIYTCHSGLVEAVTPIRIGDIIAGYMMFGQVLEDVDRDTKANDIIRYASTYIGDEAESCFKKLSCKSRREIEAAAKIMESCVCYLLMNEIVKAKNDNPLFAITQYIEQNPSEDLSVAALCRRFQLSRNTLYRMADTYLGMPVAKYVKKKRIEKAEAFIKEGVSVMLAAELTGFGDYGYFGKVFKSLTGKTPTEVKKARAEKHITN